MRRTQWSLVVPGRNLWWLWVLAVLPFMAGPLTGRAAAQAGDGAEGPSDVVSPPPVASDGAAPTESMAQATTTDADMSDQRARSHFRLGREYYRQGRFADAAQEFEIAHGLSGRSELLFNVYLAHRDAQSTRKAAAALRGYLAAVPDADQREHLTARLAALDDQVRLEDAEAERRQAEAAEAERGRQAAEQRAQQAEARAALRPSRPWWPWLLVGGGVAAIGTGLALGMAANADADELREACVANPRTDGATAPLVMGDLCAPSLNLESERSSIQTQAMVGDALWIGGAVLAATGLVLVFALPDEYPDDLPVTAGCGPGACRADVTVRF